MYPFLFYDFAGWCFPPLEIERCVLKIFTLNPVHMNLK